MHEGEAQVEAVKYAAIMTLWYLYGFAKIKCTHTFVWLIGMWMAWTDFCSQDQQRPYALHSVL